MHYQVGALKNIAAAAGLLAAAGIGETVYFYNRTMKMSGTDWEKCFPLMEERKGFVRKSDIKRAVICMTECAPVISTNCNGAFKAGSIGRCMPNCEVKILGKH